jgi:RNA polymerase sigma-70 factor (ECF subfamily)
MTHRNLKDAALLEAVLARDDAAWREFVRRFDKAMRRCVRTVSTRYRDVETSDDVDDVMSTVYLGFLEDDMHKLRVFDETRGRRLSSWVSLLAIKMAHDHFRSLRRLPHCDGLDEAVDVADSCADALDQLIDAEDLCVIEKLLRILQANDREFMERCLDADANVYALAETLGVSPDTVRSRRARLLVRLRSHVMRNRAAS